MIKRWVREAYLRVHHSVTLRHVEEQEPIIVFQMGKVGSSTVLETLHGLDLPNPVLHVHTLAPDHLAHAVRRQRQSPRPFLHEHLIVSALLVAKRQHKRFPCRLITLTREPISRAISFVFEDAVKQMPEARLPDGSYDLEHVQTVVQELLATKNGVADPTEWFDRELKGQFGVDVFAQPFDAERGFAILEGTDCSVLLLRMEDLNRVLPEALGTFLGMDTDTIQIQQANVGKHKDYASDLSAVKQQLLLPEELLDKVLATRYVDHFYPEERLRLRARWSSA